MRSDSRKGFSLPELLIVIGIIALLIAILIPTIARSRASAEGIACKSNLRQLHVAFLRYSESHNGFFPAPYPDILGSSTRCWQFMIAKWLVPRHEIGAEASIMPRPQTVPVLYCPTLLKLNLTHNNMTAYSMANCGKGVPWLRPSTTPPEYGPWGYPKFSRVRNASEKIYLMDLTANLSNHADWSSEPSLPHNNKSNHLFFDGHVSDMRTDELKPEMWMSED